MERLESGLISPDGEVYNIPYYKLGLYTKVFEYRKLSCENWIYASCKKFR